jgi:hypothetical protein
MTVCSELMHSAVTAVGQFVLQPEHTMRLQKGALVGLSVASGRGCCGPLQALAPVGVVLAVLPGASLHSGVEAAAT